jgi:hypothetical protein
MVDTNVNNDPSQQKTYSEAYVKELRDENAAWRVKVREVEGKQKLIEINMLLKERGIKADPKWIELKEKESIEEAVDRFSEQYPHLKVDDNSIPGGGEDIIAGIIKKRVGPGKTPKPLTNMPDKNRSSDTNSDILRTRQIDEIKKDPKARALLRQEYRSLLANEGHRHSEE